VSQCLHADFLPALLNPSWFASSKKEAMQKKVPCGQESETFASFRGQYVGFLNTVGSWLIDSSLHPGSALEAVHDLTAKA